MPGRGAMSFRLLGRTSPWYSVQSVGVQSRAAARGRVVVGQGLPAVYHRVISRPLGIRERLLPTRVLMALAQPMSTFHFSWPRAL